MLEINKDARAELVGQVVDIFEDYLSENEISLENEDREEAIENDEFDEPEDAAIIYGYAYDMIADEVYLIINSNEEEEKVDIEKAIDVIMNGFKDVLTSGGYTSDILEEDIRMLKDKVKETLIMWEVY